MAIKRGNMIKETRRKSQDVSLESTSYVDDIFQAYKVNAIAL